MAKTRAKKIGIDFKAFGPEPDPIVVTDSRDQRYVAALRWYNYFYGLDDVKPWLVAYVKQNLSKEAYETIKSLPATKISKTAAIQAKLIERGFTLADDSMEFLDSRIRDALAKAGSRDDELTEDGLPAEKPSKSINPHIRLQRKISNQLAEIEGLVDDHLEGKIHFSFYNWAHGQAASPQLIAKVQGWYGTLIQEMVNHPEDFRGSYARRAKELYEAMVADAERLTVNKKVVRKPRKAVPVTTEKVIKGLKYKQNDHKLKLVSISPTEIIGAKELWVYSTKYNELGVFVAATDMGLRVKGTSITEFDEAKSQVKKVRSPEKVLPEFFKGKPAKVFAALTTSPHTISARVNENVVLLKVVK